MRALRHVVDVKAGTPTLVATILSFDKGVTATALLDGQLFVALMDTPQVSVYNTSSFTLTRIIRFSNLGSHMYGLAASAATNYLYISDYDNNKVYGVDLSVTGTVSAPHTLCTTAYHPHGLSMTADGNVLVVTDDGHITEYTPSGTRVRTIQPFSNTYNYHAMELSNSMWVVSQYAPNSKIFTTYTNGTVMKTFGSSAGFSLTQCSGPYSLAVDAHGYILVADKSNNRILVVNPSLSEARQLPLPVNPALQSPLALSFDNSRGQLYVGDFNGQHRVLVFNDVTNVNALFN